MSDNVGNVYTEAGAARSVDISTGSAAAIWYSPNAIGGATSITIAPSESVKGGGAVIWEFSGFGPASTLNQTASFNSRGATATPTGAPVVSSAGEVVISLASAGNVMTGISPGNAFVNDSSLNGNGWAHLITKGAGTVSAEWMHKAAGTYASSTASFKSAASGRRRDVGSVPADSTASLKSAASGTISPCDLNQDGAVNIADVQLAVNMALGSAPCTALISGSGCDITVVQRVVNASLGGACLTSGGVAPHSVSLTWNASISSNVAGYNVYRGSVSGGPYTRVNATLVSGTSFTDSSVQAGGVYYYVSTAVDTNNIESAYSGEALATIPVNPHSVSLTWNASSSSNVAGYNVYRSSISGGSYVRLNSASIAGTSFTDNSVQAGATYYYVCTAVDTNNSESAYSAQAVAIVPTP